MRDQNGRYKDLSTLVHTDAAGHATRYLARRFLPKATPGPVLAEVVITQKMRLDLIAYRYFGDATRSWQVADQNLAMNPWELTATAGTTLTIVQPQK